MKMLRAGYKMPPRVREKMESLAAGLALKTKTPGARPGVATEQAD
jgi:hypothetical protein